VFPAAITVLLGCGGNGNSGSSSGSGASGGSGGTSTGGGGTSAGGGGTGGGGTSAGGGGTGGTSTGGGGSGGDLLAKFPDSWGSIAVLADQLPSGMTDPQVGFAATHFVGSQKLVLDISGAIRAKNPGFVVLHYHLAMWQSAPGVDFIVDGKTWGNDYPMVDTHEGWFWHNQKGDRVASTADKKLLMNLGDPDFRKYWADSIVAQTKAGQYDGVFADSASPALIQGETNNEPRLAGTGVKDTPIDELGGKTFIQVWQEWMTDLTAKLEAEKIPLIPNTGAFVTTWDNTDYGISTGIFSEGYADPSFSPADWKASTTEVLSLVAKGKVIILQNYLPSADDVARRMYYLGNYLLVKGHKSYLDYFANGPLEWYPEWGVDLGAPQKSGQKADDLLEGGVYRRAFEKGLVLVNPTDAKVTVTLGGSMKRVVPQGGGAVPGDGSAPGTITTTDVTQVDVAARGAEILLQ
jgi:hypothetical protein